MERTFCNATVNLAAGQNAKHGAIQLGICFLRQLINITFMPPSPTQKERRPNSKRASTTYKTATHSTSAANKLPTHAKSSGRFCNARQWSVQKCRRSWCQKKLFHLPPRVSSPETINLNFALHAGAKAFPRHTFMQHHLTLRSCNMRSL
jgi:hypothetical protein